MSLEKTLVRKVPLLGSSVDPEKAALSLKGFLLLLVPVIVSVLKLSGVEVLEADLIEFVNALFVVVGSVITLFGIGRKLVVKFKK